MASSKEHDDQWFDEVYRSNYPAVMRYAYRRLNNRPMAEELAQEVFYVMWRRRHDIPKVTLAWLYAVARRLLLNEWRARRTRPVIVELAAADAGAAFSPCESVPAIVDLYVAMARLGERDREILQLIGWEELTLKETAEVIGCSRMAAATRLMRARRRLRTALEQPAEHRTRDTGTVTSTREVEVHA